MSERPQADDGKERSISQRGRTIVGQIVGVGVLMGLLFAACSSAPESLESTQWTLDTLAGNEPLPGSVITVQFDDVGRVSGTAGCNSYSGPYETRRADITMGPFATTLIACEGAIGVQETAYLAALQVTNSYDVEGDTLTFFDQEGDVLVTFSRLSTDLAGTSWDVLSYNTGTEAVTSLIIGTEITLDFGTDGTVAGNSSCNSYSGSYEVDGEAISIGPLAVTERFCAEPEGVMDQEQQYLAALQNATVYAINQARLEMRDGSGALQVQANPAG